ncbi:hypothetical protein BDV95DRAFT_447091, partial [Massariosphaeria phaeospora]
HLYTLNSLSNLGAFLLRQGRYDEAEAMLRKAFSGKKKQFGWGHPSTLKSMANLVKMYNDQGR